MTRSGAWVFGASLLLSAASCGGDECAVDTLTGAPFTGDGTATIRGTATIGSSPGDGLYMQFLLRNEFGVGVGVIGDLFDQPRSCGDTFPFEVTSVEAGPYRVELHLSEIVDDETVICYQELAAEMLEVADGEELVVDLTFP